MPVINMPIDLLLRLVNADGKVLTAEQVPDTLHNMGIEVEELTTTQQYRCGLCGKVLERTEAQGAPLVCSNCGTDFRQRADALEERGATPVARLDMLAVRPDIFDPGGMARYMRGFLSVRPGLIEYDVRPPRISVQVDPRLSNDGSYRPFIACAVLRNVSLDDETIKTLMNLQEDLHWALGRNRKLASIGVYDLDTLRGETFHYDSVAPDELRFVPLGFDPAEPTASITPAEILEKHKTGRDFAHLLKGHARYPLLRDAEGTVLSMPPIINSESTRVTQQSTQLFCDVTGTSPRVVDRALNVLVTGLKELRPTIEVEAVRIIAPDGERVTPDLATSEMKLTVKEACDTIGVDLDRDALTALLQRMGHAVKSTGDDLRVSVPAWRNDIMHPIDLIEDAAVAFGYENLTAKLVPTFTVGEPREIEERSAIARRALTGLGFHQVMTLVLTNEPAAFGKWRIDIDPRVVRIENPISTEQTIGRVSLLPGLLETLAINKQHDLPQAIFEVGDCTYFDESVETGAREERMVAAAMIGTHVGYADIRAIADAFVHELCGTSARDFKFVAIEHASYIPGRVAALSADGDRQVGTLGELHPEVLENYGLRHPVAVLEVRLPALLNI